ncbi:solute carrier family 26, member 5 [Mytilus galloprovincialis]|uniref:Solute carrier family 26, member 5 n=1 Tax=Mytilus galloprovincialis TaxID=29158 RepID=A0A8B6BRH6_MYTGA|nr:solute carrier family 26, member 5 [Mytilus galloprovincialis]
MVSESPRRRFSAPSGAFGEESTIFVKRQPFTQVAFDEIHLKEDIEEDPSLATTLKNNLFCSKKRLWKIISTYLPIIKVLRYYNIKESIVTDIVSGITIGILHIPQALAFGLLTSVKVENGLYTSVWPVLLYVIFGTSAHVSMGTSAVICIVTASVVDRQAENFKATFEFNNATTNFTTWEDIPEFMDYKENISLCVAMLSGLILLFMGFLRLGFITAYLSESFFNAFTSGAAVHIATSQLPALLGINVKRFGGAFKIIYTYQEIFSNITSLSWQTPLVALVSIAILLFFKEFINEKFKHKLPIPIPVELLVVILATAISYGANLAEEVAVVGEIPGTIPPPVIPDLTGFQDYFVDCFVLAILIFANTIAMAKICAKKHNYEIDDSQELIAYGMCNFASSFLKCFPSAVAPPRSMIASNMGTKSTLAGVFVTILMLLVIMAMSVLFEPLPKAALAAIIVVALKGLFIQMADCRKFWRINKFDFVIWFFTIVSVVFLDIDFGLGIGVIVSLITVVFQTQFSRGFRVGRTMKESAFVEHKRYKDSIESNGVKIFRFQSNLYFANAEIFRNNLYKATVNPRKLLKFLKKQEKNQEREEKRDGRKVSKTSETGVATNGNVKKSSSQLALVTGDNPAFAMDEVNLQNNGVQKPYGGLKRPLSIASNLTSICDDDDEVDPEDGEEFVTDDKIRRMRRTHHIIIDCSTVNYMDSSGANVLGHISSEYEHVNIKLFLAGVAASVRDTMEHAGTFEKIPQHHIFLELHDAIAVARSKAVVPLQPFLEDFTYDEAAEESTLVLSVNDMQFCLHVLGNLKFDV